MLVLHVRGEKSSCNSLAIGRVTLDVATPDILKASFVFKYETARKASYSLDHNDKTVSEAVHVSDVLFAEVSPFQYEPDIVVTIVKRQSELGIILVRFIYLGSS